MSENPDITLNEFDILTLDPDEVNQLVHYGMPRRSGRYPWGSGKNPYQSAQNYLGYVKEMKAKGLSAEDIRISMGMTTSEFRSYNTWYGAVQKHNQKLQIDALKKKGLTNNRIAEMLDIPEPTVRNRLKEDSDEKYRKLQGVRDILVETMDKHKYVEVGKGIGDGLGVSPEYLTAVLETMQGEGYQIHLVKQKQANNPNSMHKTTGMVLAPPGTTTPDIYAHGLENVGIPGYVSDDRGLTFRKLEPPKSISSDRVQVVWGPEGGAESDGLIKLRPGVPELDIGGKSYAQVRIGVDGTHYLKGVALYDDTLPKGVDIQYFSPKEKPADGNKLSAMKPMKLDPLTQDFDPVTKKPIEGTGEIDRENPFGTAIRNQHGVINTVYEEGKWQDWSKNLPSQFLAKQNSELAKKQLQAVVDTRQEEFDKIRSLTNPVVKEYLLGKFANAVDSDAVDLKAAPMKDQATHLIVPINSLKAPVDGVGGKPGKPGEIYAPRYENGTEVVLVRFPHAGTFEIPTLRVNNNNKEAQRLLGNAKDAVGVHHSVAQHLSGADFDGDSVLVIPNGKTGIDKIRARSPLEGLREFEPKKAYPKPEGVDKVLPAIQTQREMGVISNLITDMTVMGAPDTDIVKAVRHSMVVIDAEKHQLDWKRSEQENDIKGLMAKWRKKEDGTSGGGASTLLSRARAKERIPQRRPSNAADGGPINKETGELNWTETGATRKVWDKAHLKKTGEWVQKGEVPITQEVRRLANTNDARTLMSSKVGEPIERIYADHSNTLKAMANKARLEMLAIKAPPRSSSAFKVYKTEVEELMAGVNLSRAHAPYERKAQAATASIVKAISQASPNMDDDSRKKLTNKVLQEQRAIFGAKPKIKVEPRHWEAIQAGAISAHALRQILGATDIEVIKEYATPRENRGLTPSQIARAKAMMNRAGVTQAEIASALGVSVSTLNRAVNEG